jgi:peptide chain release factor subunit 1
MTISTAQRRKLKKFVKSLEVHRGRHTELVSVYVPMGYDIVKIQQHLAQEQGTATNIKSTATRKHVVDALEKMIQHLKLYKKTPPHGLACFSGNVAEREGQSDVQVWSIEPPIDLNLRLYRCDKEFILDALREICETKEAYGLVVMDRRDAIIALLKGKVIVPLTKTHSEVPGKFRAGGQSAQRFERLRDGAAKDHYKKVGEYMKEQFLNKEGLKGIIVGGPGPTKYDFVDGNFITDQVKRKIIGIKDLSYTEEFGLQELVDKSEDLLAAEEISGEKKIMQKFFELLAIKEKMVAYGLEHTTKMLQMGVVDVLLLSESLSDQDIEDFEEEAEKLGSSVQLISVDTREGVQLKDMGGIAAILRYAVEG